MMALAIVVALPGVAAGTDKVPGTGTPGYWHKLDHWQYAGICTHSVHVAGVHYDAEKAIEFINMPVKGDKTLTMFPALAAAHLNRAIGNPWSCIEQTLIEADIWMAAHPPGNKVRANSDAWDVGEPLYRRLDAYNNGRLCAPSRG